jgi:hypothetical protein
MCSILEAVQFVSKAFRANIQASVPNGQSHQRLLAQVLLQFASGAHKERLLIDKPFVSKILYGSKRVLHALQLQDKARRHD